MTDSERIRILEEAVLIMSKCLDKDQVRSLSEGQLGKIMLCISELSIDLASQENKEGE